MIPFFGRESTSQSVWLPLGLARVGPDGVFDVGTAGSNAVRFFFEGTDPDDGTILRDGSAQEDPDPLIGPDPLGATGTTPYIAEDGFTMVFDASGLADDVFKRNPQICREYVILFEGAQGDTEVPVTSGAYDPATDTLHLTAAGAQSLTEIVGGEAPMVSLIPYFLRVSTADTTGVYPSGSEITVSFESTYADPDGNPVPRQLCPPGVADKFVTDASELGDPIDVFATNGDGSPNCDTIVDTVEPDFVRFRVHFNLNTGTGGVDQNTPRPAIEFFRMPFRF